MIDVVRNFPESDGFGTKKPRIYKAESIADFQQGRAEELGQLLTQKLVMVSGVMDLPNYTAGIDVKALVALPSVQHYPSFDPQEERRLFGLRRVNSSAMKLSDQTGSLIAKLCYESNLYYPQRILGFLERAFLEFSCFSIGSI